MSLFIMDSTPLLTVPPPPGLHRHSLSQQAGGTHPTGMLSCFFVIARLISYIMDSQEVCPSASDISVGKMKFTYHTFVLISKNSNKFDQYRYNATDIYGEYFHFHCKINTNSQLSNIYSPVTELRNLLFHTFVYLCMHSNYFVFLYPFSEILHSTKFVRNMLY